ncbi:MBL fold metallo-hydrolase [Burkholderia cenocepacia]|uniref:MBL fold metallo-hydrolase n=1 Tax=Burkholderia cenocepacia TaxID=95486 RepID=UPI001D0FBFF1|nr:MBL fold metallo-hydrolase [Burkholderia cenocepacia]
MLKKHGRSFRDINLIIITHAHTDHAGSAAQVRQLSGAPILAHAGDLDYYERRKEMTYCVAHWWGPLFLRSGLPGEPTPHSRPTSCCKTMRVSISAPMVSTAGAAHSRTY